MSRKCENWLNEFCHWCLPVTEAPELFIYYTGLFVLASALRRRVYIPREYMGSYEVYPNMYILFVGPAGGPRKSTSANASEILKGIPGCTKGPELVTKEALLNKMVKEDKENAVYVLAPEFGEFIAKSGLSMYGFLTNLYDGKADLGDVTLSRGQVFAEKPCINLLGATTPEWVAENMPISVIGGGFASRVISIYEDTVRRRKLFYDDVDHIELSLVKDNLINDLAHIATNLQGPFSIEKDAKEWMTNWYENGKQITSDQYKLRGYYNRKHVHLLKIAILCHIAHSDELVLNLGDMQEALNVLELTEPKLSKTFDSIGKNTNTNTLELIKNFISERGKVPQLELRRKFIHAFDSGDDLDRNLGALQSLEEIEIVKGSNGELFYIRVG